MNAHHATMPELTKNQGLVYNILSDARGPLSAYAILDDLREHGIRAPLQVYRALDKLLEMGLVHRLESLNSFVACQHPDCNKRATMVFTICTSCSGVSELTGEELEEMLNSLAGANDFNVHAATIELRGLCTECRQAAD